MNYYNTTSNCGENEIVTGCMLYKSKNSNSWGAVAPPELPEQSESQELPENSNIIQ